MKLTRREFLKLCGGAAVGMGISRVYIPQIAAALEGAARGNPPVLWLQGASDSGCSVSMLNSTHPLIAELLLKLISLRYHTTIMAGQGADANDSLWEVARKEKDRYILIVEGAPQAGANGAFCIIGEREGRPVTFIEALDECAPQAAAIIAVGTCAAAGGVPAAHPNPTGALSLGAYLKRPVLNIPGCPPHPDWIVGTLVHILLYGMPELDARGRPLLFFSKLVHEQCPRYSYFVEGKYATHFSEEGCLIQLGCKGPLTYADCPVRLWNTRTSWCVASGGMCQGCASLDFPDGTSPVYTALPRQMWPRQKTTA